MRINISGIDLSSRYESATKSGLPGLSLPRSENPVFKGDDAFENCAKGDHQFLMLGDTNHNSVPLRDFRRSLQYLHALKTNGYKHSVFEINEIFEDTARQYADHKISRSRAELELIDYYIELNSYNTGQFLSLDKQEQKENEIKTYAEQTALFILNVADCCNSLGMQFHFLDEQCNRLLKVSEYKRLGEHEKTLADKIKSRTGTDKTIIIYGAAHFSYDFTLRGHLGASSKIIDLYGATEDYEEYVFKPRHRTYRPDYVYVIKDKAALMPCPEYGQTARIDEDALLQNFYRDKQQHEIDKFQRITQNINQEEPRVS